MTEFRCLNAPFPILNAARSVSMAAAIAVDFTAIAGGQDVAARKAGIDRPTFKRLTQPSRQPKSIAVDLWQRLISGYAAHLRRELARLEAEIRRVDAMGNGVRPLEDLLDEVDALADRLRHIIEKQH